jgi:hypothetical protein
MDRSSGSHSPATSGCAISRAHMKASMKARMINTDFDSKHPALDGTFSRTQPRKGASDQLLPADAVIAATENPENTESVSHETMLTLHAIMASLDPSVFVKDM